MSKETMHDYVNRRMEEHGVEPISPLQMDMHQNFSDSLKSLMEEHVEKWQTVGLVRNDITMSMIAAMVFTSIKTLKDGGTSQEVIFDMLMTPAKAILSGDITPVMERIKRTQGQ